MSLVDKIRDAGEQAGDLAQRGIEKVREAWDEADARIRGRRRGRFEWRPKMAYAMNGMQHDPSPESDRRMISLRLNRRATDHVALGRNMGGEMIRARHQETDHETEQIIDREEADIVRREETRQKPIISINGRDVDELERPAA